MPPDPLKLFLFLNQLQICSAEKNTLEKNMEIMAYPVLKFLATPLVIRLNILHFRMQRSSDQITGYTPTAQVRLGGFSDSLPVLIEFEFGIKNNN